MLCFKCINLDVGSNDSSTPAAYDELLLSETNEIALVLTSRVRSTLIGCKYTRNVSRPRPFAIASLYNTIPLIEIYPSYCNIFKRDAFILLLGILENRL